MLIALKLGLTRLVCVYNVLLTIDNLETYNERVPQNSEFA